MSGVLRLSNNVTGRSTIIASASNDQTFTLPATGGTLLAGGSSLEVIFPSGTEALPGLHVQGDIDTGLYAPAANTLAISTDGTERLRIDSSGRVGIGTSSPSQKLHVNGTAYIADDHIRLLLDSGNGRLQIRSASDVTNVDLYGSNGQAYFAGNVGIGTTSPSSNLDVEAATGDATLRIHAAENNSGSEPTLILESSNDFAESAIDFKDSSGIGGAIRYNHGDNALRFLGKGINSEAMRIDSSGNVGISISDPLTRLDLGAEQSDSTPSRTASKYQLAMQTSDASSAISHNIGFYLSGNDNVVAAIDTVENGGNGSTGLVFATSSNSSSDPTERMRIDSSGMLLVGATTNEYTSANLQVANTASSTLFLYNTNTSNSGLATLAFGPSNSITGAQIKCNAEEDFSTSANRTANLSFEIRKDGSINEAMRIDSSGRVGIGTTSIEKPLHVRKDGESYPLLVQNRTNGPSTAGIAFIASGSDFSDGPFASIEAVSGGIGTTNHSLLFRACTSGGTPTERMRIDSTGAVGIGVSNPSAGASSSNGVAFRPGNSDVWFNHSVGAASVYTYFAYNTTAIGSITRSGTTSVSFNTTSDYRLKENVTAINNGITRLQQLKPCKFNFIADPERTVDGFLAHEAQSVVPECITGEKDATKEEEYEVTPAVLNDDGEEVTPAVMGTRTVPVYQVIDQSKLVPLLTAALQEAITEMETLKQRLSDAGIA